jgi:cytochrome bd-type quinol oxidase subunit 2
METFLGIDYPTLWYLVVGLLFSGYAILEGFDYGAGAWHFLEKMKAVELPLMQLDHFGMPIKFG